MLARLLVVTVCAAAGLSSEPLILSVKAVKAAPSRCASLPRLEFPRGAGGWHVMEEPLHSGENDWEVFFEIEGPSGAPLPELTLTAPGVKAARVIVGKTDVPFRQNGDRIRFRLVDDRSRGQLMQVDYQSPRGGLIIHMIHNWKMRRAGDYAAEPYPEKQIAAIPNYLLAAQELLRLMGGMGPGGGKPFDGDIVLMGSENAATRGHLDYPPHVHIMHYQFDSGRKWLSRLVPHLYMDPEGRIVRNNYAVLVGRGQSGELGPGEVCRFEDAAGKHILDLIIGAEGLTLRCPDGRRYSLRPDPKRGAATAVYGYREDEPILRVESHDDPAKGTFEYRLDTIGGGRTVRTFRDGYRYDPFTAKVLSK